MPLKASRMAQVESPVFATDPMKKAAGHAIRKPSPELGHCGSRLLLAEKAIRVGRDAI